MYLKGEGFVVILDGVIINGNKYSKRGIIIEGFYDATLQPKTKKASGASRFISLLKDHKELYEDFCEILFDDFVRKPKLGEKVRLIQVVTDDFGITEEKKALTKKGWHEVVRIPFSAAETLKVTANFLDEYAANNISIGRGSRVRHSIRFFK